MIVYCGLSDNFLANILPLLALPTGVFLVKQFIDQIPDSLIEAALVDGATDFQIMKNIIFPLIKSPLSTVAILSFSSAWNSVEASTYYINNDSLKTFSFYVSTLSNQSGNVVAGAGVSAAGFFDHVFAKPDPVYYFAVESDEFHGPFRDQIRRVCREKNFKNLNGGACADPAYPLRGGRFGEYVLHLYDFCKWGVGEDPGRVSAGRFCWMAGS